MRNHNVHVIKFSHPATKEKRYTPAIRGKTLRLSWNTKTRAEIYGAMVLNRYVKKLAVAASQRRAKEE